VAAVLVAATCACSGGGGAGFWELTRGSDDQMVTACERLFGKPEALGKRLGLELQGDSHSSGTCTYPTVAGALSLTFSEDQPYGEMMKVRGEKYWIGLSSYPAIPSDKQPSALKWLRGRADAISDDYDAWVAGLPVLEESWASADAASGQMDPVRAVGASMSTPAGTVHVASVSVPAFVVVGGSDLRAADGEELVSIALEISRERDISTYEVLVDGVVSAEATEAVGVGVQTGTMTLTMSIPDGAEVVLAATTGEVVQRIDLLTGEVDDDGLSERLGTARRGTVTASKASPKALSASGEDVTSWRGYLDDPYGTSAAWSVAAWDDGPAPDGQEFFRLELKAASTTSAHALTAADAVATVNGVPHPATSWDPQAYTYVFLVPAGADRIEVTVSATLDPAKARWGWNQEPTGSYSGPLVYSWSIDTHDVVAEGSGGWSS